jgi:hypothetical protein
MRITPLLWDRDRPVPSGHFPTRKAPARSNARAGCLADQTTMTDYESSGQEPGEWGDERCEWCNSLSNVSRGFVHDVSDESWTDYDALCRECFIDAASDDTEATA